MTTKFHALQLNKTLETSVINIASRNCIDLNTVTFIGRGSQRLLVGEPKTGRLARLQVVATGVKIVASVNSVMVATRTINGVDLES